MDTVGSTKELLLDVPSDYEKHWVNMPEFIQNKRKPFAQIIVRVTCQQDLEKLSKCLEQMVTIKTKSVWFPPVIRGSARLRKRYVDES